MTDRSDYTRPSNVASPQLNPSPFLPHPTQHTSFAILLPLCPRPRNTGPDNARQLLTSHSVQHADRTDHQCRHEHSKAGEQEKGHADILPLARGPAPLHRLCVLAVAVLTHDGGTASALVAGSRLGVAGAVAAAVVGEGRAVLVVGEAGGEEGAEWWERVERGVLGAIGR